MVPQFNIYIALLLNFNSVGLKLSCHFMFAGDDEQNAPLLPQALNISLSGYSGEEVVELCYQSVEVFMAVRNKALLRGSSSPSQYSESWVDLSSK